MNQITLPVTELKQTLSGLGKVISRKSTLPVLQSIRLSRNDAGQVSLSATDLDAFVTYHVEASQPGAAMDVLLPFEQLNKSVKGSNGDVIVTAESKDKAKLRYQIGDSPLEQSVSTLKPDEFPPAPKITQAAVKMPASFGETLRQAFETSSTNSSRYVLHGAYLDVQEPKCHTIVSTNGQALFAANTFKFDLKASVNIAKQKFLAWPGFLEGECQMAVQSSKKTGGYVQLTTPRWNCIVKQIDGLFPKWRQVVPQDTDGWTRLQLSEAAIAQMLNLSTKLPGDDTENRTIQLRAEKELHLEGRNKDDKEFTGAVIAGVNIVGKPVTIALNREYLQTALRCGLNEIRIHTELKPLVFISPGKQMVVMPVRLNGTPTAAPTPAPKPAATTQPITPPQLQAEAQPERKTEMPKANTPVTPETKTAFPELITHVDRIKDNLKTVVTDLNTVGNLLRTAEKEKRATDREIETVRATLRKIQNVTI